MAGLGYVVPQGQDSKESFHALRRTTEGLLYYTKVNKNGSDSASELFPPLSVTDTLNL